MCCLMVRSTEVPCRSGSGMIMPRSSRNCRTRRIAVLGRELSALTSASWTGASAPSQASRIRSVLVALLRGPLSMPQALACRSSSSTRALAASVRAGSRSSSPAFRKLQSRRASNKAPCAGSTGCAATGCSGLGRGGCIARPAVVMPLGACLSLRLAGSVSDDARGSRTPGRRNPSWSGRPGCGHSIQPGSSSRTIIRQGRHSPSRSTWVTRLQRRQAAWPGKARRHLEQAAQQVY